MSSILLTRYLMGGLIVLGAGLLMQDSRRWQAGLGLLMAGIGLAGFFGILASSFLALATLLIVCLGLGGLFLAFAERGQAAASTGDDSVLAASKAKGGRGILPTLSAALVFVLSFAMIFGVRWDVWSGWIFRPDSRLLGHVLLGRYLLALELMALLVLGLLAGLASGRRR